MPKDNQRVIQLIQKFLEDDILFYDVLKNEIIFFSKPDKILLTYKLGNQKLWYDHEVKNRIKNFFSGYEIDSLFIEALKRFFKSYFKGFEIKSVEGANIEHN